MKNVVRLYPAWIMLSLVVWWLYVPSLGFGLIWDDPTWFHHSVGKRFWQLFLPNPTYHFYRPLSLAWIGIFVAPNGLVNAPLAHAAEIWIHLINTALVFRLAVLFAHNRAAALAAAALFATFPFAHQAVAWAAPTQPITTTVQLTAWLLFWYARRSRWLLFPSVMLFVASLLLQESSVLLSIIPLGLQWLFADRFKQPAHWWDGLLYVALAGAFLLIWWLVPKAPGASDVGFRPIVIAWFAQGFIYPLAKPLWQLLPAAAQSPWTMIGIAFGTVTTTLLLVYKKNVPKEMMLLALWIAAAILPAMVALDASYVLPSPRLFYTAAPPLFIVASRIFQDVGKPRAAGAAVVALVLTNCAIVYAAQNTFAIGARHLQAMVATVEERQPASALFINFPDQYTHRDPPYPIGVWGWPIAPIVEPLSAFVESTTGFSAETASIAMPWVDSEQRGQGPYHIDLRGIIQSPQEAATIAQRYEAVYVTRFSASDRWQLERAGSLAPSHDGNCAIAIFADAVCLQGIEAVDDGIDLRWIRLGEVSATATVFVHVGLRNSPPAAQKDGDAWSGVLPIHSWPTSWHVVDHRPVPLDFASDHVVRIGLYDWTTGERFAAISADGTPLADNAVEIPLGDLIRAR